MPSAHKARSSPTLPSASSAREIVIPRRFRIHVVADSSRRLTIRIGLSSVFHAILEEECRRFDSAAWSNDAYSASSVQSLSSSQGTILAQFEERCIFCNDSDRDLL